MKKNILVYFKDLITVFIIFSLLSSCSAGHTNATDILFEVLDGQENIPVYNIFYSGAPGYSESYMSSEKAAKLYRDENMISYCESFACALGREDEVWEIHIFIALSSGDAAYIENALTKRLDILQDREIYIYDTEIYENRIASGKILRKGRLVALVICDSPSVVLDKIKSA